MKFSAHSKKIAMEGDGYNYDYGGYLNCGNYFTMYTHIKTSPCTPYIYTYFYQVYLSKAGGKENVF